MSGSHITRGEAQRMLRLMHARQSDLATQSKLLKGRLDNLVSEGKHPVKRSSDNVSKVQALQDDLASIQSDRNVVGTGVRVLEDALTKSGGSTAAAHPAIPMAIVGLESALSKLKTLQATYESSLPVNLRLDTDISALTSTSTGDLVDQDRVVAVHELFTEKARDMLFLSPSQASLASLQHTQARTRVAERGVHVPAAVAPAALAGLGPRPGSAVDACVTEAPDSDVAALVAGGIVPDHIVLWKKNSVLKWKMDHASFPDEKSVQAHRQEMKFAAKAWNLVSPGGVKFEETTDDDFHFHIMYENSYVGSRLMRAFFPGNYGRGTSKVIVYPLAEDRGDLANIFLHELGHVLGFRHSFALKSERSQLGGTLVAENKTSVMSYERHLRINTRDVTDTRALYEVLPEGGKYKLNTGTGMKEFIVVRRDPRDANIGVSG